MLAVEAGMIIVLSKEQKCTSIGPQEPNVNVRSANDGSLVQDYAARVGLPPQLIPTLRDYADGMGLLDIMTNMLYDDPLPPDGAKWFTFQSPYQKESDASKIRNFTWNVERPAKKWKSDMHWFNTGDELRNRGVADNIVRDPTEKAQVLKSSLTSLNPFALSSLYKSSDLLSPPLL
jgi:hypothetical protein